MATDTLTETAGIPICPACMRAQLTCRVRTPLYRCRQCGWQGDEPARRKVVDILPKGEAK